MQTGRHRNKVVDSIASGSAPGVRNEILNTLVAYGIDVRTDVSLDSFAGEAARGLVFRQDPVLVGLGVDLNAHTS